MTGGRRMSPDSGDVADAEDAAAWAVRRALGGLSTSDSAALAAWLARPERVGALKREEAWLASLEGAAAHPDIVQMRSEALAASSPPRRVKPTVAWIAAAAIVLTLAVGWQAARIADAGRIVGDEPPATTRAVAFETAVGEHRELRLDDGSRVTLDTGSRLEVAFTPRCRALRLVRGQALFQVAHNRAWPFVVTAGDRQVTAVGTAFDVRIDGPRVLVVLTEGRVKIESLKRGLLDEIPLLSRPATLAAGEVLESDGRGRSEIATVDAERATSWREGRLVFRDEPLASAASEFNRYSVHPIVVLDPRVGALKVSGVFRVSGRADFVAAVTSLYPVRARPNADGAIVLDWRAKG